MDDDLDTDPVKTLDQRNKFWIDAPNHLGDRRKHEGINAHASKADCLFAELLSKIMVNAPGNAANDRRIPPRMSAFPGSMDEGSHHLSPVR